MFKSTSLFYVLCAALSLSLSLSLILHSATKTQYYTVNSQHQLPTTLREPGKTKLTQDLIGLPATKWNNFFPLLDVKLDYDLNFSDTFSSSLNIRIRTSDELLSLSISKFLNFKRDYLKQTGREDWVLTEISRLNKGVTEWGTGQQLEHPTCQYWKW